MGVLILVIIFFLPGGMLGFAEEKFKERRDLGIANSGIKKEI
jgi:hypothetical protein